MDGPQGHDAPFFARRHAMFTPESPCRNIPPELQARAARIATMGRIVIQAFIPPELLKETERRLYLTALGEMLNASDDLPPSP